MSTILKALRRLEQEQARSERPLREQVTGSGAAERPEAAASRRWPVLIGGIGAGVAAGLGVLFLVLSRGDAPPEPTVAELDPPARVAAATQAARTRPGGRNRIQPIPPAAAPSAPAVEAAPQVSDEVAVLDRGTPEPRIAPGLESPDAGIAPREPTAGSVRPTHRRQRTTAPPSAEAPAAAPAQTAAARPPAAAAAQTGAGRPPAAAAAQTGAGRPPAAAPTPAPSQPATGPSQAAEAPRAASPAAEPRAVAKAPSRLREPAAAPFPALRVERTVWHPIAERRLAVVDVPGDGPREVREGDDVAGAVVALIEPSGVVFRHAGRDVRRKVGGGS